MVTYLGSGDRGFAGHLRGRYKQHARANGKVKQVGRLGGRQRQISWDSFWFSVFYIRTRFLSLFGSAITDNIFSMNGHILSSSTRFPGIVKRQAISDRRIYHYCTSEPLRQSIGRDGARGRRCAVPLACCCPTPIPNASRSDGSRVARTTNPVPFLPVTGSESHGVPRKRTPRPPTALRPI